jgi:hypothetical protein
MVQNAVKLHCQSHYGAREREMQLKKNALSSLSNAAIYFGGADREFECYTMGPLIVTITLKVILFALSAACKQKRACITQT